MLFILQVSILSEQTMLSSLAQLTSIKLSFCVPTGERGGGGGGERERIFKKKKKKKIEIGQKSFYCQVNDKE